MSFITISKTRNAAGKAVSQAWGDDVVDDLEFLNGQIGTLESGQILNGSFEIASNPDEPNIPDSWTRTLYPGGTGVIDTTSPRHGGKAYKFTHPGGAGNGGGYLMSDFTEVTAGGTCNIGFIHWVSAKDIHVKAEIYFYDKSQVIIGSATVIWDSTENPTSASWALINDVPIPSTAVYCRVRIYGGVDDVNVAGDVYFDYVTLESTPASFEPTGAFTIAEANTGSTSYIDLSSSSVELPVYGIPVIMTFPVETKVVDAGGASEVASHRYRVGTNFSDPVTTNSLAYIAGTIILSLSAVEAVNTITVVQQLKISAAPDAAWGKKLTDTSMIAVPNF